MSKDKFLVLFIFGVALAAGIYAWVFQYNKSLQVLKWLGPERAHLVTNGDSVFLLELGAANEGSDDSVDLLNRRWNITNETEITNWKGLVHARYMLSVDVSYIWEQSAPDESDIHCTYAIRFTSDETDSPSLVIGFDPENRLAVSGSEVVAMGEMSDQLLKYLFETTDH